MLSVILSSKYFIVQSILILSYFPIRYFYLNKSILNAPDFLGYTRESIVSAGFILFTLFRYKRYYTIEHFLMSLFFFAKVCILSMIYMGGNLTILAYYLSACLFAWLIVKPGAYNGKSNLIEISDKQFEQTLNNKANAVNGSYIFLVAYAPFSDTCFMVR